MFQAETLETSHPGCASLSRQRVAQLNFAVRAGKTPWSGFIPGLQWDERTDIQWSHCLSSPSARIPV